MLRPVVLEAGHGGRDVHDDLGALQGEGAGHLGERDVVTDRDADAAWRGIEDRDLAAWTPPGLLRSDASVERERGDVGLAVDTDQSCGSDEERRVVRLPRK